MKRIVRTAAILGGLLFLAAVSASCKNRNNGGQSAQVSDTTDVLVSEGADTLFHFDPVLTDVARLMAGLPVDAGSPESGKMETDEWKAHKAALDEMWAKSVVTLEKVAVIRDRDLTDIRDTARTVLYSFSGPDLPFMMTFYPSSDTYYMMGLERVGTVPTPRSASKKHYEKIEYALRYLLDKSYFVTSQMSSDLNNAEVDGTIPILMVLLARMDYVIESVNYQSLTAAGQWQDSEKRTNYVRIRFFNREENRMKTLYYLSSNIQDSKFNSGVEAMLKRLDSRTTAAFVKSCSYCLHYGSFSKIRNIILDHSFSLIQDDTGIPYRTLKKNGWAIDLYGGYTHPMDYFPEGVNQKDLDKVYKDGKDIKPLDFRFGYNRPSSLIVARKERN